MNSRIDKGIRQVVNNSIGLLVLLGTIFMLTGACSAKNMDKDLTNNFPFPGLTKIGQAKWDNLAQKKIFFGHQSVGNNIMQGVKEILAVHPEIHLHVAKTREINAFNSPIFAHSEIGKNEFPLSKIEDFVDLMNNGLGDKLNIAMFKFCFVDIHAGTDIENIFNNYKEKIFALRSKYPDMTIVHITVPLLRKEQTGTIKKVKDFFRNILGNKKDDFFSNSNNVARNEYNKLLTSNYAGKEPVFDLARLESTHQDGSREVFSYQGKQYYALAPEYTKDGGHLNEKGRKYIAEQFLIFLANL